MKRFLFLLIILSLAISSVGVANTYAQNAAPMTEAHINRIRSNCIEAQSSLNQLHATDALLRVNRGQLYESISTKLMAPFNSRVLLNRMDGSSLVTVSSDYDRYLAEFRVYYQQYEESMSRMLKINCVNQPVAFYDSVAETRDKRKKVHDSTVALLKTIQAYKTTFESFVTTFEEAM